MGRHCAASGNYSLCSRAFAAFHSLLFRFSFLFTFVNRPRHFFLLSLGLALCFFVHVRVLLRFSSFFFIFALNYLFFFVRDFLVWLLFLFILVSSFFSLEIYCLPLPRPPFLMIFTAIGHVLIAAHSD